MSSEISIGSDHSSEANEVDGLKKKNKMIIKNGATISDGMFEQLFKSFIGLYF